METLKLTDLEVAQAAQTIAEWSSNIITYDMFDGLIGISDWPNNLIKQHSRTGAMRRINNLMESGMVVDDTEVAYVLRVAEKNDHFKRENIGNAAIIELGEQGKKIGRLIDRASRNSAYALGLQFFEKFIDRKRIGFKKPPPPELDESTRMILELEYRQSQNRKQLIQVLFEQEVESQEYMSRLISRSKRKSIENKSHDLLSLAATNVDES